MHSPGPSCFHGSLILGRPPAQQSSLPSLRGGDSEALLKPRSGPPAWPAQHSKAQPKLLLRSLPPHVSSAQEDTPIHYPADEGNIEGPLCPLDSNLSHFILVESGTLGSGNDGLAELQLSLEKHISQQRTGYGGKACSSCPAQHFGM